MASDMEIICSNELSAQQEMMAASKSQKSSHEKLPLAEFPMLNNANKGDSFIEELISIDNSDSTATSDKAIEDDFSDLQINEYKSDALAWDLIYPLKNCSSVEIFALEEDQLPGYSFIERKNSTCELYSESSAYSLCNSEESFKKEEEIPQSIEKLECEMVLTKKLISEIKEMCHSSKEHIDVLVEENNTLKENYDGLEMKLSEVNFKMNKFVTEKIDFKEEMELFKEQMYNKIEDTSPIGIFKEGNDLKQEIVSSKKQDGQSIIREDGFANEGLSVTEERNADLKQNIDCNEEYIRNISYKLENDALKKENKDLMDKIDYLQGIIVDKAGTFEITEHLQRNYVLENQKNDLERKNYYLSQKMHKLQAKIVSCETEIWGLKNTKYIFQDKNDNLLERLNELHAEIYLLKKDRYGVEDGIESTKNKNYFQDNKRYVHLKCIDLTVEKKNPELNKACPNKEGEPGLDDKNVFHQDEKDIINDDIEELKGKIVELKNDKNVIERKIGSLRFIKNKFQIKVNVLKNEKNKIFEGLDKIAEKKPIFVKQIADLKERRDEFQSKYLKFMDGINDSIEATTKDDPENQKHDFANEMVALKDEKVSLQDIFDCLKIDIDKLNCEKNALYREIEDLKAKKFDLHKQNDNLEEEKLYLEKEYISAIAERNTLLHEIGTVNYAFKDKSTAMKISDWMQEIMRCIF